MISKKYKAIHIHIEKTGGTSIEQKLGLFKTLQRGVQDHRKLTYYEHIAQTSYRFKSLRFSLYHLKRKRYDKSFFYLKNFMFPELSKKQYESYYKFTFVRNTWARIYSYHYNIMRDAHLKKVYGIPNSCSLFEFIKSHLDYKNFNQLDYIKDSKSHVNMDFIGRFENLEFDFKKVCQKLQIESSDLPQLLMVKDKKNYKDAYDQKTRDLVYELFQEEIDYFKFQFGE